VGIGCVEMVVGRIGSAADSETVAIFIWHPCADRRMIFDHMAVAIDYFVYLLCHGYAPSNLFASQFRVSGFELGRATLNSEP
jgi:hypothetical protein